MDRNTLLNSSRATFLSTFNSLIEGVVRRSFEQLYDKADKSINSQMQRHMLDARTLLMRNDVALIKNIVGKLEALLNRSFQTAYDTFRPSFFTAGKASSLALMDLNTFEDDLRVDIITSRFRSEAEEQLRDLNIRIAILFERNDIAERENPFRPYLLTRAIVLGVEAINAEAELAVILTDQLAEELGLNIVSLYESINQHLSECGVAAQLQFKPQRMPSDLTNPVGYEAEGNAANVGANEASAHPRHHPHPANKAESAANKAGKIEHLLQMVKHGNPQQMQSGASYDSFNEGSFNGGGGASSGSGRTGVGGFGGSGGGMAGGSHAASPMSHGSSQGSGGGLLNHAGSAVSGWLEGAQEVGDALRRVFLGGTSGGASAHGNSSGNEYGNAAQGNSMHGEGHDQGQSGGAGHFKSISPQLSHALHSPVPSTGEMTGVDGEVRNLIIESRDSLNAMAADQHEKMTIDIVAMLFEFILKDHQVPAEVRAQLGRLQFSVLKMALMDSALLTKKSHPARLLVNRIGSISVGLQQIDPTGERISAEICRIVEELLASDSESPELFSKMLDQLDVFIARELLASNTNVEQAVNVVINAEHRSERFSHASAKLEKMLDGIAVTPYLRRFLLDTWSHVIERVERNPHVDSTRFRLLVPNLLWSILPKASHDDRAMLLQVIPGLVPVLREGMSLVAWLPEHQQELLNWLVDAHTTVMRAAASIDPVVSLVEVQRHFHEFVYPDDEPLPALPVTYKGDVNRSFLDEAIRELELELHAVGVLQDLDVKPELIDPDHHYEEEFVSKSEPETEFDTTSSGFYTTVGAIEKNSAAKEAEGSETDILDRLRSGVIVEINLSGTPTKGRLNWISPNSSNLILTVNGQEAPSIISVRMFRRMLKSSRARFVEVAPLFERAVQSLLESADLVDLAHAA
ncbi:DUF1631 family protein [Solimicrobium silvestre]|nr:DUF1631 family protein [Solimicrobium silvestre]